MNALLIVAHGSRRQESNEEIRTLTRSVASKAAAEFDLVDSAFLELAEPLIPAGVQALIDQGADDVLVVPYFLACGTHVAADIPMEVAKAQSANPSVRIRISGYLGTAEGIPGLLIDLALHAKDS